MQNDNKNEENVSGENSPKHTPGPWLCHPSNESDCEYRVFNSDGDYLTTNEDIAEANARLIAAAPDLFAACEASHNAKTQVELDRAVKMISDAIAKAKGE